MKIIPFYWGKHLDENDENALFDVKIGLHPIVYELVGIYLSGKSSTIIDKKNISLYRDNWFSVIENANGAKLDCLRKNIIAIFHNEGLNITVNTNLTTTHFPYVILDPCMGK